jgi:hypothetical protein
VIRGLRQPVRLTTRESLQIFDLADIWAARTGNTVRLVSANDHVHARRSAHYAGVAVDLHTSDPAGLSAALRKLGYRVLWNVPGHHAHVHVEAENVAAPRTFPVAPVAPALRERGFGSTATRASTRPALR